ncbi:hypothetical protein [Streptomyces sp. NPDC051677]|uniref:hypothetical protein n=1 Tax=Streptomyces sp. NPDC051677 TaxID=3365669 RepID=UPI0037D280E9
MPPLTYEVHCTEQAAAVRDRLDRRQRTAFDQGVAALAQDPFPSVSRPAGSSDEDRTIRLTRNIHVAYTARRGRLLVFGVAVFEDADILVADG